MVPASHLPLLTPHLSPSISCWGAQGTAGACSSSLQTPVHLLSCRLRDPRAMDVPRDPCLCFLQCWARLPHPTACVQSLSLGCFMGIKQGTSNPPTSLHLWKPSSPTWIVQGPPAPPLHYSPSRKAIFANLSQTWKACPQLLSLPLHALLPPWSVSGPSSSHFSQGWCGLATQWVLS